MAEYHILPSRRLRLARLALHAAAALAVWLAALPPWLQVAVSLVLLASAVRALLREALVRLRCRDDGRMELARDGDFQAFRVSPGSVVLPGLCVLALRAETNGERAWLTILPDGLAADDFRRLRVWLRWKAGSS